MTQSVITHYEVYNRKLGKVVSTHKTRAAANRKVDRIDNAHGSYISHVNAVWSDPNDNLTFLPEVSY